MERKDIYNYSAQTVRDAFTDKDFKEFFMEHFNGEINGNGTGMSKLGRNFNRKVKKEMIEVTSQYEKNKSEIRRINKLRELQDKIRKKKMGE